MVIFISSYQRILFLFCCFKRVFIVFVKFVAFQDIEKMIYVNNASKRNMNIFYTFFSLNYLQDKNVVQE